MDITYRITFYTDWHCGSGLAAGADVDALVIKDADGLPFIPGKTMKGLIREAAEDLRGFASEGDVALTKEDKYIKTFGYFKDDKAEMTRGLAFFTDAELPKMERDELVRCNAARHLYRSVASTAIGDKGIAKDHSLRKMEVVVPCELEGRIINVPDDMNQKITDALHYIKRLGQNRNRGLGRCSIEVIEGGAQ